MAGHRLYFVQDIGPYESGLWYDNVPQADAETALAHGWAKVITEDTTTDSANRDPCGCLLVDGRAIVVRTMRYTGQYCSKHLPDALHVPQPYADALAEQKARKSLFDEGVDSGLIKPAQ